MKRIILFAWIILLNVISLYSVNRVNYSNNQLSKYNVYESINAANYIVSVAFENCNWSFIKNELFNTFKQKSIKYISIYNDSIAVDTIDFDFLTSKVDSLEGIFFSVPYYLVCNADSLPFINSLEVVIYDSTKSLAAATKFLPKCQNLQYLSFFQVVDPLFSLKGDELLSSIYKCKSIEKLIVGGINNVSLNSEFSELSKLREFIIWGNDTEEIAISNNLNQMPNLEIFTIGGFIRYRGLYDFVLKQKNLKVLDLNIGILTKDEKNKIIELNPECVIKYH